MAASTTDTESAQALFCALADYVGTDKIDNVLNINIYPTFWHFSGYTDNNAKGYNSALKIALREEKKKNRDLDEDEFTENFKTPSKEQKDIWKTHNEYLTKAYSRIDVAGVRLEKLKKILDDEASWYKSSCIIAKKLIDDIRGIQGSAPGGGGLFKIGNANWNNIYYYRGDSEVMGTIAELFKLANDHTRKTPKGPKAFGDVNKWSPADMYFATDSCKKALKDLTNRTGKGALSFDKLNSTIANQIAAGQILPLSLKKVKDEAHLVKVNWDQKSKQGILDSVTYQTQPEGNWAKMKRKADIYTTSGGFKWKMPSDGKGPIYKSTSHNRDIYLKFKVIEGGKTKNVSMQFRHTPTSSGKPQRGLKVVLSYEAASAAAGQVVGIDPLCRLIAIHDKAFARQLKTTWQTGMRDFITEANAYNKVWGTKLHAGTRKNFMGEYLHEYQHQFNLKATEVSWGQWNSKKNKSIAGGGRTTPQKKIFNADMGAISGVTVMNRFRMALDKGFKAATPEMQNAILSQIFQYATSRSVHSGMFVIAK
tara:strand:- start:30 stop:1637 length:1608 start_codon:yes stop_codon:yes gene_type:complete